MKLCTVHAWLAAFASALSVACTADAAPAPRGDVADLISSTWYRQRPGAPEPPAVATPRAWSGMATGPLPAALARRPFHQEIVSAATRAGIDPALVHAVIRVESAYNARVVSPKGAVGLMQVVPGTGRRFGVDDLLNPGANIRAGTQYLSHLMRIFEGDVSLALAAYNAGENAVLRYGRSIPPYRETRGYVPRVLGVYQALAAQGQQELARPGAPPPE